MDRGFSLKLNIVDNSPEALSQLNKALTSALTKCGLQAERTAKEKCPVAQPWNWHPPQKNYIGGTLRNSITFALDGKKVHIPSYDNPNEDKDIPGRYDGQPPKETGKGLRAMYVGTNVYYAPYVEMGTVKMPAREFIRPAFTENAEFFRETIKNALIGTMGSIT